MGENGRPPSSERWAELHTGKHPAWHSKGALWAVAVLCVAVWLLSLYAVLWWFSQGVAPGS